MRDPTDDGQQPRGKQVRRPRGIWYTAVTGIWQTVWLEPVPARHVSGARDRPGSRSRQAYGRGERPAARARRLTVSRALDGATRGRTRGRGAGRRPCRSRCRTPHKWSPADPFLYTLRGHARLGDEVDSYFGMRRIAVRKDADGVQSAVPQRQAAVPARPARPGLVARRPLHRRRPTRRSRTTSRRRRSSAST